MAFEWYDWLIFSVFLGSSLLVGFFVAWKNSSKSTSDFLQASKSLTWFPVTVSLFASFTSAITLISTPSDIYKTNTDYIFILIPWLLGAVLSAHTFFKFFYRLDLTSSYEYLMLRFGSYNLRRFITGMFMIQSVVTMGIALYAPSLSFSAANDDADVWIFVLAAGVICTIYTTIGGLRAVVWVDVAQALIMVIVTIIILVKSWSDAGGISVVIEYNVNNSKIKTPNFGFDPYDPNAFWNMVFYTFTIWATFSVNQVAMQRCLSCKNELNGKLALYGTFPINFLVISLCVLIGLSLAVIYPEDPYISGEIKSYDQLLTYYVKSWQGWDGFLGLYSASLYSGAISTVSSSQAVLAQLTVDDFIKPIFKIDDERALRISRLLMVFYGGLAVLLAWVASHLGDLLRPTLSIMATFAGPFLGLFLMAVLPVTTQYGCMTGTFLAFSCAVWICVGSLTYSEEEISGLGYLYKLSYLYQGAIGCGLSVAFCFICSFSERFLNRIYKFNKYPYTVPSSATICTFLSKIFKLDVGFDDDN